LPTALDNFKRRAFYVIANASLRLYGWFPVFGTLRAALGVIYKDGKFLVIHRNDGRGVCLPGGLCSWREAEEGTLDREVREETGMTVSGKEVVLRYHNDVDFACNLTVFRAQASGNLRNSWEGSPQWRTVEEIEPELVESQRPVMEVFRRIAAGEKIEQES
jgi:8-oxo-dGTP pyrophosphatase MutT (NUDIX family)